jgi:hypothetical protein
MEEDTKEITLTIKKKDKVYSIGQTEENMKEDGKMESNMEQEFILQQVVKQKWENGKMEKDFIGCNPTTNEFEL